MTFSGAAPIAASASAATGPRAQAPRRPRPKGAPAEGGQGPKGAPALRAPRSTPPPKAAKAPAEGGQGQKPGFSDPRRRRPRPETRVFRPPPKAGRIDPGARVYGQRQRTHNTATWASRFTGVHNRSYRGINLADHGCTSEYTGVYKRDV